MITHDEAKYSLYFLEITADLVVFDKNQKIVEDYITQQEQRDKDVARFLELTPKPVYRPLHGEAYDLYNKLTKGVAK